MINEQQEKDTVADVKDATPSTESMVEPKRPVAEFVEATEFNKTSLYMVYALFLAGAISAGLATLGGLIFAYVKLTSTRSLDEKSHYHHVIKTFWFGLIGIIASYILTFGVYLTGGASSAMSGNGGGLMVAALISTLIMLATFGWILYRVIKGIVKASEGKGI